MVPAVNIHGHKVKLQPHIGIKAGFKKNKDVNTHAYNCKRPVPDVVYCGQVYTKQTGDNANDLGPGLMAPPFLEEMNDLH
jgi:hypothetical protein